MPDDFNLKVQWTVVGQDALDKATASVNSLGTSAQKAADAVEKASAKLNASMQQVEKDMSRASASARQFGTVVQNSLTNPSAAASQAIRLLGSNFGLAAAAMGGFAVGLGALGAHIADQARQLENLAAKLGLSVNATYQMQASARIAGVDLGNLQQAVRTLALAMEQPITAGKRASDAIRGLGIAVQDMEGNARSPGAVFQDIAQKLSQVTDSTQRAANEVLMFGRDGARLDPLIRNFSAINKELAGMGVAIDENGIHSLDRMAKATSEVGIQWDVLKFKIAAALAPLATQTMIGVNKWLSVNQAFGEVAHNALFGTNTNKRMGPDPQFNTPNPQQVQGANAFREWYSTHTEEGISADIAEHKRAMEELAGKLSGNLSESARTGIKGQFGREQSAEKAAEARLKALRGGPRTEHSFEEEMSRIKKRSDEDEYPSIIYGEVGKTFANRAATIRGYQSSTVFTAAQKRALIAATEGEYNTRVIQQSRDFAGTRRERLGGYNKDVEALRQKRLKGYIGAEDEQAFGLRGSGLNADEKEFQFQHQMRGVVLGQQAGAVQRQYQMRGIQGEAGGENSIASEYQSALELAQKLNEIRLQTADQETDIYQKRIEQQKAYGELVESQQQAELNRAREISNVDRQQKDEAANFFQGLFRAGISGQPSASQNYLRGYGQNIASTIVGNASKEYFGSFQQRLGVGASGILGTSDHPNPLGKLFANTPLSFSAADMAKDPQSPIVSSQGKLKSSIDKLNDTIVAATGSGSYSGGNAYSDIAQTTIGSRAPQISLPNLTGGTFGGGYMGSGIASYSNSSGAALPMGGDGLPAIGSGSSRVDTVGSLSLPAVAGKLNSVMSSVSGVMSGATTALGGHALQGIITGGIDNGNGTGQALSTSQRIGAAAGLAGGTYKGISTAAHDFSQGGPRGIAGGIGASLGTAAMYDPEPISHGLLSAGGAIAGVISSLFPDPRQQRQKYETRSLISNKAIEPAQHMYSDSVGGGGVDYSATGGMRSGAQQGNYTVNVSAMDAAGVYSSFQQNQQAFSSSMGAALGDAGISALNQEIQYHQIYGG